jgi:hypothetical protein
MLRTPDRSAIAQPLGEVPEWSIGAVSKTVERASVPRVRIPLSPPAISIEPAGLSQRLLCRRQFNGLRDNRCKIGVCERRDEDRFSRLAPKISGSYFVVHTSRRRPFKLMSGSRAHGAANASLQRAWPH